MVSSRKRYYEEIKFRVIETGITHPIVLALEYIFAMINQWICIMRTNTNIKSGYVVCDRRTRLEEIKREINWWL
jgi:hypothetical protein